MCRTYFKTSVAFSGRTQTLLRTVRIVGMVHDGGCLQSVQAASRSGNIIPLEGGSLVSSVGRFGSAWIATATPGPSGLESPLCTLFVAGIVFRSKKWFAEIQTMVVSTGSRESVPQGLGKLVGSVRPVAL